MENHPHPRPEPEPNPEQVAKMAQRKACAPGLRERHSSDTVLDLELGLGCSRDQGQLHDLVRVRVRVRGS